MITSSDSSNTYDDVISETDSSGCDSDVCVLGEGKCKDMDRYRKVKEEYEKNMSLNALSNSLHISRTEIEEAEDDDDNNTDPSFGGIVIEEEDEGEDTTNSSSYEKTQKHGYQSESTSNSNSEAPTQEVTTTKKQDKGKGKLEEIPKNIKIEQDEVTHNLLTNFAYLTMVLPLRVSHRDLSKTFTLLKVLYIEGSKDTQGKLVPIYEYKKTKYSGLKVIYQKIMKEKRPLRSTPKNYQISSFYYEYKDKTNVPLNNIINSKILYGRETINEKHAKAIQKLKQEKEGRRRRTF